MHRGFNRTARDGRYRPCRIATEDRLHNRDFLHSCAPAQKQQAVVQRTRKTLDSFLYVVCFFDATRKTTPQAGKQLPSKSAHGAAESFSKAKQVAGPARQSFQQRTENAMREATAALQHRNGKPITRRIFPFKKKYRAKKRFAYKHWQPFPKSPPNIRAFSSII